MRRSTILLTLLLPMVVLAQSKIAVYDSQAVLNQLPDKAQAETKLQAFSDRLQAEYKTLQADFDKKYAEYQAIATDPATPAAIRDRRVQEVQESDKRIQAYQQQAARELKDKEAELMAPINAAINAAVREVGDQMGYDLILDTAKTPVSYISSNVTDITPLVMQKLGL
ncbi:MAG: OmpH family outer membrane protein [Muribaculaceae bacterium]|nr:OmpH family outer membrane protein [Muribaculaceae bacterium]